MKSQDYWKRRFEQIEAAQNQKSIEYYHNIEKQYRKAADEVEKQILKWYSRFATENGVSMAEAKRLLNSRELAEFRWDVKEYIAKGEKIGLDNTWMKQLENASAKVHVSRLEALKVQIQQRAEMLYAYEHDSIDELARKIYTDGYYHSAFEIQKGFGVGWDLMKLDTRRIDKVISKPWAADGMNFSGRIWRDRAQLVNELHTQLTQTIITGGSPETAVKALSKRFDVSKAKARRLVMTESAFFASASQRDCFNDLDVEKYEIVATLDLKTSQTCRDLDGKVFPMSEYNVGVTAPPFHVYCRTVTVPWFEDNEIAERAARGADGKTYYVKGDMKYDDWYNSFVEGGSKEGLTAIVSNVVKKVVFTPASSVEEAEQYARDLGVENVSFKKIDLNIANEMNQSLMEHFNDFPELKQNVHYWGSAQEKKNFLGDTVRKYYEKAYERYRGVYPDDMLDKRIKSKVTSYFRTSGEWAHAFDHRKFFSDQRFSGIAINKKYGENLSLLQTGLKQSLESKWHPIACDTVKSIFDHEFGHQLDYLLNISNNPEFLKWISRGIDGERIVGDTLSRYAVKGGRKEIIAEAWAEYRNNPEPRTFAKAIGELIESEYERKFGK